MFKNNAHRTQSGTQRLRAGLIFLALALVLGSAGQVTPAVAAPAAIRVRMEGVLEAKIPPDPICAGQKYDIPARLANNEYVRDQDTVGEVSLLTSEPISGINIRAWSGDESIASIQPPNPIAGWDVENDLPGETSFTMKALKAGYTTLNFRATYNGETKGPTHGITVKECSYRVTMSYSVQQSGPGYFSILFSDALDVLINREGEIYKGTDVLDSTRIASVAGCDFSASGYEHPTSFTGTPVASPHGDEIQLTIEYGPGTHTDYVSCPNGGGGGTEDPKPSDYLETSMTFPTSGGTKSFPVNFAYWSGQMLITLTPVESSAQ